MSVKHSLFTLANRLIAPLPIAIERTDRLAGLRAAETRLIWQHEFENHQIDLETVPRAQLGQDLFALWATSFLRGGYFVEFGAADGISFSNTFLLERSFGWNGLLAEPAKTWHTRLHKNRTCAIDERCVWGISNQTLTFAEPKDALVGTISDYIDVDNHGQQRRDSITYAVETVSLNDLLEEHSAPTCIDYLSVDTEGTELEILRNLDFNRYGVRVITVEHAYDALRRDRLYELLQSRGFIRVLPEMSRWDDWYVHRSVTLPSAV